MTTWSACPPPKFRTVLLSRPQDLHPVVGFFDGESYRLEAGGDEDGDHQDYRLIQGWVPEIWAPCPSVVGEDSGR